MDREFLIIACALISIMVSIIGYFLNKQVIVTETLVKVVSALNTTVALLKNDQTHFVANYEEKQAATESRFISHSNKLHEHSTAILLLQADISKIKEDK